MNKKLYIAEKKFNSRLFIGTGKYSSSDIMKKCLEVSGTNLVTVALKRMDINNPAKDSILPYIDKDKYLIVPNTSGARTAEEAVKVGKYALAAGFDWIKLEIHPDPNYLLPDPIETYNAAKKLVDLGFKVMPYINADPVLAKRLEEIGCVCVMPLAAPIGSNRGITNELMLKIIIKQSNIPVVIDAGLGLCSHAARAIELGADAVLINTAIAIADDPVETSKSFKLAIEAAEINSNQVIDEKEIISKPSSPLTLFLEKNDN